MSKKITADELAEIVKRLLTDTQTTGELDGFESFQGFMTDIAQVVCNYCGGEVSHQADALEGIWHVGIKGNESLPSAFGGIWREYDKEGELFTEGTPEWLEAKYGQEHPEWPKSDWQYDVVNGDTKLGYWDWVAHNVESEAHDLSTCSECGEKTENIIGCPDGAEVCPLCFDGGSH